MNLGRQEGSLFSLPENQNVGDERKSDILPWQLPWLCVGIMALWWGGEFLQSPITAAAIVPPTSPTHSLRPALVQSRNSYTWPSLSPRELCPFHGNNLPNSAQNTGCPGHAHQFYSLCSTSLWGSPWWSRLLPSIRCIWTWLVLQAEEDRTEQIL